jgi:hypothetical protein
MPDLTLNQIQRQDEVDNIIMTCIQNCADEFMHGGMLEWDQEIIAEIRESIQKHLVKHHVCTEMQFYPYLEGDQDEKD